MSNLSKAIVRVCVNNTLSLIRSHSDLQWPADSYWWPGIQLAWAQYFWPETLGNNTVTTDQLHKKLFESGVPIESIKKSGKHTMLVLDNISFVYRDKKYKGVGPQLQVSPQMPGKKYNECGHSFVQPMCSADDLVTFMLAINESIPDAKTATLDAYHAGLRERKEREILQQVANEYVNRLFDGDIPGEIISCTIADSTPGAMDLIRLTIRDKDAKWSSKRTLDIPFSERDKITCPDQIRYFILDSELHNAIIEIFVDDESGDSVPILRNTTPFNNE